MRLTVLFERTCAISVGFESHAGEMGSAIYPTRVRWVAQFGESAIAFWK
ncbi:hypothetical protein [Aerosakkonema funiforme]